MALPENSNRGLRDERLGFRVDESTKILMHVVPGMGDTGDHSAPILPCRLFRDRVQLSMQRFRTFSRFPLLWLLASMAVFGQIIGAAAVPDMAGAAVSGIICTDNTQASVPGHSPAHQHHDCAACPLCAAAAVHLAILPPATLLPAPAAIAAGSPALPPPARAPPSAPYQTPYPTGPPAFA